MDGSETTAGRVRIASRVLLCLCLAAGLLWASAGLRAQMSPEEHASHHGGPPTVVPSAPAASSSTNSPAGTATNPAAMSGMMGGNAPAAGAMGGGGMGGGGMGNMMKGMMGGATQPELYPSLMALPNVPPDQRLNLRQQAEVRARMGQALLQQGTARITNPDANDTERREAAVDARAGLNELESGQAAGRALADGQAPRAVALQWFQHEMNLVPPDRVSGVGGGGGITPFHIFTMVLLALFALAMVVMYFFKMRRAAALFGRLDSKPGSPPPPGQAPPLAGSLPPPPPPAPDTPPGGKTPPPDGKPPPAPDGKPPIVASSAAPAAPPAPEALQGDKVRADAPVTANWRGTLRVGSIVTQTPSVKTFRLLPSSGDGTLPFVFSPGQFLNVAFPIGGARMNRSYSISSSPNEREYVELTVRREPRGAVSRHIDDLLKVGDEIETGGPVGKFTFNGTEADSIVLISGGVGITPMMSISRFLTERSWPGDIFFIYTCRTPADFIFADEIAALERRNPKLHVAVTVSKPEGTDWKGARGRITKEWLTQTVPDLAARRTHMCGPPAMMDAIKAIFAELGIPPEQLKTEAFGAVKPVPAAPGTAKSLGPATGPLVTFSKNNKSAKVHMDLSTGDSPPRQSILELSEELVIGIEFSCRVGTCGVCKTKMTSGTVDQEVQDALDDDDKAKGIILACQAKPTSDVTVEA